MMKRVKSKLFMWTVGIIVLAGSLGLLSAKAAWAQVDPRKLAAIKATADRVRALSERMSENERNLLSSGAQNLINISEHWDEIEPLLSQASLVRTLPSLLLSPKMVSNPNDDNANLEVTRLTGFTQSETFTAWCGTRAVVGFNDSGSIIETIPIPGTSFNGVARSNNADAASPTYTDLGFLPPGPDVDFFLMGDPVLACTDASTFYYASLFSDAGTGESCISVSKSTNGGASFGDPVKAVCKDGMDHFLDKEWMAVDPTNANRIFVTYTDFDGSGTSAACGAADRTAIELVRSTDGGMTWGAPKVIRELCDTNPDFLAPRVEGPQVAVGPDTDNNPPNVVYVAWEEVGPDLLTRSLKIRRSTNNGTSFGNTVKVANVTTVGEAGVLFQGFFRPGFEFPSLAVNRTGGARRGHVYLAWNDARFRTVPDAAVPPEGGGTYGYADVLFSRSTNGGTSWSAPVKVNDNTEPPKPLGTDQYQPAIGVDNSSAGAGKLGVCFYDRRRDPRNFRIDRFCATSTDNGTSWTNTNRTPGTRRNWSPVPRQDILVTDLYMGDYDVTATDFTRANSGFITTWGDNILGNPDVQADKFN